MANHRKSKKQYRANHFAPRSNYSPRSSFKNRARNQKDETEGYIRSFIVQTLVCLCLLMGVLVAQQGVAPTIYKSVRGSFLSEFPFSTYHQWYQNVLGSLFPFSYRVPAKENGVVAPVSGNTFGEGVSLEALLTSQLVGELYNHVALDSFADGVLVQKIPGEMVSSFTAGVVVDKGIDDLNQIGQYIVIQRPDQYKVTIGLLQNLKVDRYEHIALGDVLGNGTYMAEVVDELEAGTFYYVAIQNKEGDYIDVLEYLRLMH